MSNIATFRILRNKIGSLSSHLHSGYPVKQSPGPSPSLPLSNSSAAAMAYNSLYQHFPPYTPPISSPAPSANNNNNNSPASSSLPPSSQTSCSPTKSEPGPELASHNSAVSSACFNKWPGRDLGAYLYPDQRSARRFRYNGLTSSFLRSQSKS